MSREELVRISNYLTESCGGLTLRQIRDKLLGLMARERAALDEMLADAVDLAQQALGADDGRGSVVSRERRSSWVNRSCRIFRESAV